MTLEEDFKKLQTQHDLPNYAELDKEFDISCIENYDNLIREIRHQVSDNVDAFVDIIEPMLQPETTVAQMHESVVFNEFDKEQLFSIFKKVMLLKRKSITLKVLKDDAQDAAFVKEAFTVMSQTRTELLPFLKRLEECWTKDTDVPEQIGYLG